MDNCIFCKIISGDIPSATIYEDNEFKVILDRFPSAKGHVLILPKVHVANIFEIDSQLCGRLYSLAVKVAGVMKKTMNFDGMNVLQNNGEAAGQTVHHFHVHLIPRYKDDNISIKWNTMDLTDNEIEIIRKELEKKF